MNFWFFVLVFLRSFLRKFGTFHFLSVGLQTLLPPFGFLLVFFVKISLGLFKSLYGFFLRLELRWGLENGFSKLLLLPIKLWKFPLNQHFFLRSFIYFSHHYLFLMVYLMLFFHFFGIIRLQKWFKSTFFVFFCSQNRKLLFLDHFILI